MMGEPDSDKPNSQLLKRRKTGSNILRRLSLTGNKKRLFYSLLKYIYFHKLLTENVTLRLVVMAQRGS